MLSCGDVAYTSSRMSIFRSTNFGLKAHLENFGLKAQLENFAMPNVP